MPAGDLERIYLLKSMGVDAVLNDIATIDNAFAKSAQARANLAGGTAGYDTDQLKVVNQQLAEMLKIQNQLLATMRGITPEFAKTSSGFDNVADGAKEAAGGINDLSGAAKALGGNLTGAASGLLKVQSTLNAGNVVDYDDAMFKLASDFIRLKSESNQLAQNLSDANATVLYGSAVNSKYTGSVEEATIALSQNKTQLSEVVTSMNLLNETYNPAVAADFTLAVQQDSEAMKLNAAATQEAIDKKIALNTVRADINAQVKEGVYVASGRKEEDYSKEEAANATMYDNILAKEEETIDKMQANQQAYMDKLEADDEALTQKTLANDLKKVESAQIAEERRIAALRAANQKSFDSQPTQQAKRKVNLQEERTRVELIKNRSIVLNEEASYYQRLLAQVNLYRISLRLMTEEELAAGNAGAIMSEQALKLDAELRSFNKNMGDSTRDIGKYGLALGGVHNIQTMFFRQLIRGVGSLIIFGLLFEGVTKAATAIEESIPGTDAYIQKQEKLAQANKQVADSFSSLGDSIQSFLSNLKKSQDYDDLFKVVQTLEDLKRIEQSTKPDDKQNSAAQSNFEAAKARRLQEISDIKDQIAVNEKLKSVLESLASSPNGVMVNGISIASDPSKIKNIYSNTFGSQLPEGFFDDFQAQLDKAVAEFGDIKKAIPMLVIQYKAKLKDLGDQKATVEQQTPDDLMKQHNAAYQKNVELERNLLHMHESIRQLREAGDAESVDKIVADTEAKYQLMYGDIQKQRDKYLKDYTGDKSDPEYIKAVANFNAELGGVNTEKAIELLNKRVEFRGNQINAQSGYESTSLGVDATNAKYSASYGYANYGKMADALDKETEAKKAALKIQHDNQVKFIDDNYQVQSEWKQQQDALEKRTTDSIENIDKEAYQQRLALGIEYFKRIIAESEAASTHIANQIDHETAVNILTIMRSNKSDTRKDNLIDKATKAGIISKAHTDIAQGNNELSAIYNDKGDDGKTIAERSGDELDLANASGDKDRITNAKSAYNTNVTQPSDAATKKIDDAQLAEQQALKKNKDINKELADQFIDIAATIANQYVDLLAKQDAYRHEMAERSLAWNEKIQESEVQSNNERLAEDKANLIAQQQLDREKAIADKKRAEEQIIINTVIAAAKDLVSEDYSKVAVDLAQGAILEAFLAQAPTYAQGTTGHPGGLAWVGDGNENELIKFGNQLAVSPNKATLTNLPAGAQVTPFSKIASVPGDMGASLRAPNFVSTLSSDSGNRNTPDYSSTFDSIHATLRTITKGLANIQVNNDPKQAKKAQINLSHTSRSI